jgi:hypothetical protein
MNNKYTYRLRSLVLGAALSSLAACSSDNGNYDSGIANYMYEATDPAVSPQKRMIAKKYCVLWYLSGRSHLTEMEATLTARTWQQQLEEEGARFPAEYFIARLNMAKKLAHDYLSVKDHQNAHKLFNELLNDKTLTTQQQIKTRMTLAREYIFTTVGFKPENDKDIIETVMELANGYTNHPELTEQEWFEINYALVYMYCHSARISKLNTEDGRSQAIKFCTKMLVDPRITDAHRKIIEKGLAILNRPDSTPEDVFAFEQK